MTGTGYSALVGGCQALLPPTRSRVGQHTGYLDRCRVRGSYYPRRSMDEYTLYFFAIKLSSRYLFWDAIRWYFKVRCGPLWSVLSRCLEGRTQPRSHHQHPPCLLLQLPTPLPAVTHGPFIPDNILGCTSYVELVPAVVTLHSTLKHSSSSFH